MEPASGCRLNSISRSRRLALKGCLKISVVKKTLARLPKTLGESYDRIILFIPHEYTKEAYYALLWLAFSERPVHIREVAEAAILDPVMGSVNPEDRLTEPQDIIEICSSLVTIPDDGQALDELRLAHFTVKEHLVGEEIRQGPAAPFALREVDAHAHIAHVCLFVLHQFGRHDSLSERSFDEFPLLKYAAQFWPVHVRKMGSAHMGDKNLELLMSSIFDPTQGGYYFNWLRVYNHDYMGQPGKLKDRTEDLPPPLYLASHLNLICSAQKLLADGIDVNLRGEKMVQRWLRLHFVVMKRRWNCCWMLTPMSIFLQVISKQLCRQQAIVATSESAHC